MPVATMITLAFEKADRKPRLMPWTIDKVAKQIRLKGYLRWRPQHTRLITIAKVMPKQMKLIHECCRAQTPIESLIWDNWICLRNVQYRDAAQLTYVNVNVKTMPKVTTSISDSRP